MISVLEIILLVVMQFFKVLMWMFLAACAIDVAFGILISITMFFYNRKHKKEK